MQDHPQIRAFTEAALLLRAERYWHLGSIGEQTEFLRALSDVLTEVCYHLDANDVLPLELLKAGQDLAAPAIRNLPLRPSAQLVLMSHLDRRIEQLIAAPDDSRNTGAKGSRSA
ncbi:MULTISPECIES: hypothetical protein [unclassified Arthrobacter]|uniref:hypothetical protein n=1 Tax=unclassified Arthrobacter TaxID=235627 RepID=UPI002E0B2838|nr:MULTISPECIES: hypothetical protein [unclassified Arthrobacter]MEC5193458.1 hypothetical protein [Arthrobacter sp. MP_M4]MEC5204934.1 hypothetical protein [Arthrobacter sp. MP_M7]